MFISKLKELAVDTFKASISVFVMGVIAVGTLGMLVFALIQTVNWVVAVLQGVL